MWGELISTNNDAKSSFTYNLVFIDNPLLQISVSFKIYNYNFITNPKGTPV